MVVLEAYRCQEEVLQQQHSTRKCVLENMGEVQVSLEDRVTRDTELVRLIEARETSAQGFSH